MNQGIHASIYALAGLCLASATACSRSESTASAGPTLASVTAVPGQPTAVAVDGKGFTPAEVRVEKDKPASLVFTRTTESTCAREVVFPELKVQKALPLNTPVSVDVPTAEARTLTFQCGMGMFKSAVVIH
jgi:plastocyanin domain-containing protein